MIQYSCKFSRIVNFVNDQNLECARFNFQGSFVIMALLDDELSLKAAKITSLENLYEWYVL